jgi:hypothetical protein
MTKEEDFVNPDFIRKTRNAPLIPDSVGSRSKDEQIRYWRKLASSLNHAAQSIQEERDELNKLILEKEAMLVGYEKSQSSDRMMIHHQLANENEEKQKLLEENQSLHAEIRGLEERLSGN